MKTRTASRLGITLLSAGLLLIAGVTVFVSDCDDEDEVFEQPNAATQKR
jgi:hypothetical protein